jgi:prevent-host-death family protein
VIRVALKRAKGDLYALVRAVEEDGERIVLTRLGRPVAALVPPGALAALDLLGRMLPDVADVAAGLPDPDLEAPGLGPAPAPRGEAP